MLLNSCRISFTHFYVIEDLVLLVVCIFWRRFQALQLFKFTY